MKLLILNGISVNFCLIEVGNVIERYSPALAPKDIESDLEKLL